MKAKQNGAFVALLVFSVVLLFSCGSTPKLYNWYTYTNDNYSYIKGGNEENTKKLLATYEKILNNQKGTTRGTIPPGICADYGMLLLKAGKTSEGKEFLNREMELYPESAAFIKSVLRRIEK